jgi:hypothetical protein
MQVPIGSCVLWVHCLGLLLRWGSFEAVVLSQPVQTELLLLPAAVALLADCSADGGHGSKGLQMVVQHAGRSFAPSSTL